VRHKLTVYKAKAPRRWYVSCNKCGDQWVPEGPDGWLGRAEWRMAMEIGMMHQRGVL
jgi:phage terminase large subunit GpA-like protein